MQGDGQLRGAPCEYGDPVAERLLSAKAPYLSDLLRLDLIATYSYLRLYRPGDRLPAHRDRPACEITVSAPLSTQPDWPLRMLVEGEVLDFRPVARDAVAFRGHELLHWRDDLPETSVSVQALFHYVRRNGPFRTWAYDRRFSGLSATSTRC